MRARYLPVCGGHGGGAFVPQADIRVSLPPGRTASRSLGGSQRVAGSSVGSVGAQVSVCGVATQPSGAPTLKRHDPVHGALRGGPLGRGPRSWKPRLPRRGVREAPSLPVCRLEKTSRHASKKDEGWEAVNVFLPLSHQPRLAA